MQLPTKEEFLTSIRNFTKDDFLAETITPLDKLLKNANSVLTQMELLVFYLQGKIVERLSSFETKTRFKIDRWTSETSKNFGGISCVLQEGTVFAKAGVNVSAILGDVTSQHVEMIKRKGFDVATADCRKFYATGISCIIHPKNPFVPSFHFNFRYFEVTNDEDDVVVWWFGGNADLTPYYVNNEDFFHFHQTLKKACDKHDSSFYFKFKENADNYMYLKHREEYRGIGGIIFELSKGNKEDNFDFVYTCLCAMTECYVPIVESRKDDEYTDRHLLWQQIRRGRYIEFNLLYDRGTKFGLNSPNIRAESVLMALPLDARWDSMYTVEPDSEEEKMMEILKEPKNWV